MSEAGKAAATAPRIELLSRDVRGIVHAAAFERLWASRGRRLLRRPIAGGAWEPWAELPLALPRDLFSVSRLGERASRADQCLVHPIAEETALAVRDAQVYRVHRGELTALGRIQGDCPLKASVATATSGAHYFGEYFRNPERAQVRVWRVTPGGDALEEAFRFQDPKVRHVHGVQVDRASPGTLWVTTGDDDGECHLWRTSDEFRTLERLGDGTQRARAVHLFFTSDHVIWFMDSNLEQNHLMSLERATGRIDSHQPIESPVWYGAQLRDGVFVAATTVEDGPGVQTDYATLFVSNNGFDWHPARRFRKDPWKPRSVFKYGVISFASGELSSSRFWISGEGLSGLDGVSAECAVR